MTPPVLSGALIDCDGTLVDTEPLWTVAERETISRWGGESNDELERALVGASPPSCAAVIARHVGVGTSAVEDIQHDLMSTYDGVLETAPLAACPGAEHLLCELSARGVAVVVVSNSAEHHVEQGLVKAGLRDLVSGLQSPGPGLEHKPAPDLYVAACERFVIDPRLAVAIEDTQVGVDAARAAGLVTLGVPSVAGVTLDAHRTAGSLQELGVNQLEALVARERLESPGTS